MQKKVSREEPEAKPVLTVQDVSYWYGAKRALEDVSFEVYPGRVAALLGPNGAGKTTLFSLITRLFDAPTGRIEICGKSAADWGARALGPRPHHRGPQQPRPAHPDARAAPAPDRRSSKAQRRRRSCSSPSA